MDSDGTLHVVFFPWLAFGHMLAFLEVAKKIAVRGHKVTFISTARNIDRLLKTSPSQTSAIDFLKLRLPQIPDLPPSAEATSDVELHNIHLLKIAADGLQGEISAFLQTSNPDCIVFDFNSYWLPSVAREAGVISVFYSTITSWTVCKLRTSSEAFVKGGANAKYKDLISPLTCVPFSSNLCYKPWEAKKMMDNKGDEGGIPDGERWGRSFSESDIISSRGCNELDGGWLKFLADVQNKPVIPMGLLPPPANPSLSDDAAEAAAWGKISAWLDKRERGTVVYIALGSEAQLTQELLNELAHGVEISGVPFVWAFKVPDGLIRLPEGFTERTGDRGLVWSGWVPQVNVLAHESVGGFLTHCGWASLVEGLAYGRPLVMLPWFLDQGPNARIFEEKQVGIEIERNEDDGVFSKESVADALLKVMAKGGSVYVENAVKIRQIFGDEALHGGYIDNFLKVISSATKNGGVSGVSEILH